MTPASRTPAALPLDFSDFIAVLDKHRVDFVLVGGYALAVHGVIRATGDIDFLYRRTGKNVTKLLAALEEFRAPPEVTDYDSLMRPGVVMQFGRPPERIDLLNEIDGVAASEVWKGAITARIGGHEMRVIGLDELRRNKSATGRAKDADDLRRLNARQVRRARKTK